MSWQVVVVTGASRGYGQAICFTIAKAAKNPTYFVISGRNGEDLASTKDAIQSVASEVQIIVEVFMAGLSDLTHLEDSASRLFSFILLPSDAVVSRVVFFNNHGAVQPLGLIETTNLSDISTMINLNVTGFCFLTSDIVRRFKNSSSTCTELVVVNISSLAAVAPLPAMAIYCAGKAARDMYLRTLAEELKVDTRLKDSGRRIRLLNYAPGPMDTKMAKEIIEAPGMIQSMKDFYIAGQQNKTLVDVNESVTKLLDILQRDKYENAQHIDFYDAIE